MKTDAPFLSRRPSRVLIIEDETDVADLIALNLRKSGPCQVTAAADGVRGLMRARPPRAAQRIA
jgi:CheY-like chemotaxis protein